MYFGHSYNKKNLHLVSFDIPMPANYGGAIDVFYKIKAFYDAGYGVHLHCFQYGRDPSPVLDSLCASVRYYKRDINKTNLFRKRPYIVATRSSEELMKNLVKEKYPILLEGIHTCHYLEDPRLRKRKRIVRTHNIEHEYYESLGNVERNIFKRYYFFNEASKLRRYEQVLQQASGIAAISLNDQEHFSTFHRNVKTVTAFHAQEEVNILPGRGEFALYHASLEVGENNRAALFLTKEVFNDLDIPLVIAGNKPSKELRETVRQYPNVTLNVGLSNEEISHLVSQAQINILPTFQATGIKLKLLLALHSGRHCIVNSPMVTRTGLEDLCVIADSADTMKDAVKYHFNLPFSPDETERRRQVLLQNGFTNKHNIKVLADMLFC